MLLFFFPHTLFIVCSPFLFFRGLLFFPFRPGSKRETISKRKLAREKMKQKQKQKMFGRTQIAPSLNVTAHAWLVPNAAWKVTIPKVLRTPFATVFVLIRILNSSTGKGATWLCKYTATRNTNVAANTYATHSLSTLSAKFACLH